jgi:hypothetical protein
MYAGGIFTVAVLVLVLQVFGPSARDLNIKIRVVDRESGTQIPSAKLQIMTECYGLVDNCPRVFLATADGEGNCEFKQRVDYAISRVIVIAWDNQMERRGVAGLEAYLSALIHQRTSDPNRLVWSHPNRKNFNIEIHTLSDDEMSEFRDLYDSMIDRALRTRERLQAEGIESSP